MNKMNLLQERGNTHNDDSHVQQPASAKTQKYNDS